MPVRDDLGLRMKNYERVPKTKLMRRCPVIIRIDGKAFHTFTRGFQRPFDEILIKTMQETTKYLCKNIQGSVLGYTQSDEINLVLIAYKKFTSSAWFGYKVQKMCSVAASMATMAFNRRFVDNYLEYIGSGLINERRWDLTSVEGQKEYRKIWSAYNHAGQKGAMFDACCFNIPKKEVANYIYWRQLDASRNSIQMVGQAKFSHKELQNKSCNAIKDMLLTQKYINWNDLPTYQRRGSCVIKRINPSTWYKTAIDEPQAFGEPKHTEMVVHRTHWVIDKEIPIFKGEGREYIDKLIYVGE